MFQSGMAGPLASHMSSSLAEVFPWPTAYVSEQHRVCRYYAGAITALFPWRSSFHDHVKTRHCNLSLQLIPYISNSVLTSISRIISDQTRIPEYLKNVSHFLVSHLFLGHLLIGQSLILYQSPAQVHIPEPLSNQHRIVKLLITVFKATFYSRHIGRAQRKHVFERKLTVKTKIRLSVCAV